MKNYSERTQDILRKARVERQRRRRVTAAVSSVTCLALVVCISLALFLPQNALPGELSRYSDSEYYPIITKLNDFRFSDSTSDSFWDKLMANGSIDAPIEEAVPNTPVPDDMPVPDSSTSANGAVEITDLQVADVGEADRIKRTGSHIFYLRDTDLYVYSIAGEASREVGRYTFQDPEILVPYYDQFVMYLSDDGNTVTILSPVYNSDENQKYTMALNLDVSDPTDITECGRMYVAGNYLSSRLVDGELYLINQFIPDILDFNDPTSFVPYYGTPEGKICVPMDSICSPEELTSIRYTVVCKLDGKTLEMMDTAAYLSYSTEVYVSADSIYLTRSFTDTVKDGNKTTNAAKTEISRLGYDGEKLEDKGSTVIDGRILNQYSMDQQGDILRVVTTIESDTYRESTDGETSSITYLDDQLSASLYCIDLNTWQTVAAVEAFAPFGEEVRSVRFDGDSAYVCTSVVLTDPVFFFDLSDLENITWKDTGTIAGYSLSLVDFAEGYLMGIGYGDSTNTLKIELYREAATTVESYCKYEQPCAAFSQEYKSYYIDRENSLIGLSLRDYSENGKGQHYLMLHFDGYGLNELAAVPMAGDLYLIRGVYIDGYLYVLGDNFAVEKIG